MKPPKDNGWVVDDRMPPVTFHINEVSGLIQICWQYQHRNYSIEAASIDEAIKEAFNAMTALRKNGLV